jgi:hypothetical protein
MTLSCPKQSKRCDTTSLRDGGERWADLLAPEYAAGSEETLYSSFYDKRALVSVAVWQSRWSKRQESTPSFSQAIRIFV